MTTNKKRKYNDILERTGNRIRPLLSFRRLALPALFVGVILAGFVIFSPDKKAEEFIIAGKMNLVRDISATGKVRAAESVNLAFERSGRVVNILSSGARVRSGSVIASLDNSAYAASLKETRGALEARQAELANLLSGAKPEDVGISEAEVFSAEQVLSAAGRELVSSLEDNTGVLSDILNLKIAGLFTEYLSGSKLNITLANNLSLQSKIETAKNGADAAVSARVAASYAAYSGDELIAFAEEAITSAEEARVLMDDLSTALNGPYSGSIDASSWKTIVTSARSSISLSLDKLRVAKDKYVSAKNSLSVKKRQLELKKSGATESEIATATALVKSAEGRVESVIAEMEKGIIRSPISGIVAKTEIDIGETATAGSLIASVISDNLFIIEANIAENDIAKIKIGDTASVTLDAYGSEVVFEAEIISIDPGETILEGVATYRAVFEFISKADRAKSGMTANIDIRSGEKVDVIALPQRSVVVRNGGKYVVVLREEGVTEEVAVETGFRSSDGYVEITSGIEVGDKIVSPSSVKK